MEYPKSWERELAGWETSDGDYGDFIVTNEDDGLAVHRMKNINWLATLRANRKKLLAVTAAALAVIAAVVVVVKLLASDE